MGSVRAASRMGRPAFPTQLLPFRPVENATCEGTCLTCLVEGIARSGDLGGKSNGGRVDQRRSLVFLVQCGRTLRCTQADPVLVVCFASPPPVAKRLGYGGFSTTVCLHLALVGNGRTLVPPPISFALAAR